MLLFFSVYKQNFPATGGEKFFSFQTGNIASSFLCRLPHTFKIFYKLRRTADIRMQHARKRDFLHRYFLVNAGAF